jgi:hypothetical protein
MTATRERGISTASVTSACFVGRARLQRKCACGGTPAASGECAECQEKREAKMSDAASGHDFGRVSLQPKLAINQPNDEHEREADRIAEAVTSPRASPMRQPTDVGISLTSKGRVSLVESYSKPPAADGKPMEQKAGGMLRIPLDGSAKKNSGGLTDAESYRGETARVADDHAKFREGLKTPKERGDDKALVDSYLQSKLSDPRNPLSLAPPGKQEDLLLLRKENNEPSAPSAAPPIVHEVLAQSGQPLDAVTRSFMERRIGHDFSRVRVHTDTRASASATAVSALAYTVGDNIVFSAARFSPGTSEGQRLLAHELAHVVQQSSGHSPARLQRAPADSSSTVFVQIGETDLRQVARRLSVDPDELLLANPEIIDPSRLKPGQVIYRPVNQSIATEPISKPDAKPAPAPKPAPLPADEEAFEKSYGETLLHAYQQGKGELAKAHEIYRRTGKVPATTRFAPIEIKRGQLMSRSARYDAMAAALGNGLPSAKRATILIDDVTYDNRDPDYLTREELHDEFWQREKKEYDACDDDNFWPKNKKKCRRAVDEKYGGESFIAWRDAKERAAYYQYQRYQEKVEAVAGSGPISLAGRVVGQAIGGEKGAEYGAAIGGFFDTALPVYAGSRAAKTEEYQGTAGLEVGRDTPAAEVAPPPETTHETPDATSAASTAGQSSGGPPQAVTDVEVVKTNATSPSSIKPQKPSAHQADWHARGGSGTAPPAYRDGEGNVRVSTDHPLLRPASRAGIPPVSSGGHPGESAPVRAPTGTGAAPGTSRSDAGHADTGEAPPPANAAVDPQAKTPPAQPPAKPPPEKNVSPQADTGEAVAESQRSQAPRGHIDPPQSISEEAVERIRNQPRSADPKQKGKGGNVHYSVDHEHQQLAWQRLGGRDTAPPAFIYDKQVYLDPSRWPPKH